jgi:hypothetical protein
MKEVVSNILVWVGATLGFILISTTVGLLMKLSGDMASLQEQVSRVDQVEDLIDREARLETEVEHMQTKVAALEVDQPFYLQLSSGHVQSKKEAHAVALEYRDADMGFGFDPRRSNTDIVIPKDGAYFAIAAGQVGANDIGSAQRECVRLWMSLNGKDVNNSNVKFCFPQVEAGESVTDVLVSQGLACYKKGDVLRLMSSADSDAVGLVAFQPSDGPFVPSMIFSMYRLGSC